MGCAADQGDLFSAQKADHHRGLRVYILVAGGRGNREKEGREVGKE